MGNDNVKDYPPYLDYPKPRKPQTNAERIRAMTDEELAETMLDCFAAFYDVEWSKQDILDWLKQEASE